MDARSLSALFSMGMPGMMTNPLFAAQNMYEYGVRNMKGGEGRGAPINPKSMQDPMAALGSKYDVGAVGKGLNVGKQEQNPMLSGRPDSGDVSSFVSALLGQVSPGGA